MWEILQTITFAIIGAISPLLIGAIKNFFWVGYTFIEAFVFMLAFNYVAPILATYGMTWLPTLEIGYWFTVSGFLLIGFVGNFIKKLTPTIVKISSKSEPELDNNKTE